MDTVNAQIRIVTRTEGKRTVLEAPALWRRFEGGESFRFADGADFVTLTLANDGLSLLREGEREQSAAFIRNALTDLTMRLGGFVGHIPLFTHFLRVSRTEGSVEIRLDYELRFEGGLQKFHLNIFVRSFSEEA